MDMQDEVFDGFDPDPAGEAISEEDYEEIMANPQPQDAEDMSATSQDTNNTEDSEGTEVVEVVEDDGDTEDDDVEGEVRREMARHRRSVMEAREHIFDPEDDFMMMEGRPLPSRDGHRSTKKIPKDPDTLVTTWFYDDPPLSAEELENLEEGEEPRTVLTAQQKWDRRVGTIERFIPTIYTAYGLGSRHVPPCWKQHPPLVTVLSAMVHEWYSTFYATSERLGSAEDGFINKMRVHRAELELLTTGRTCVTGEHQPWPLASWVQDAIPPELAFLKASQEQECATDSSAQTLVEPQK